MLIFLIGFMGSGKSTTGKLLAARLKYRFADLDDLIGQRENMPITQIFASRGEDYFRIAESAALKSMLAYDNMVVACGGGTPCFFDNMQQMKSSGLTIYLKVSSDILADRLSAGGSGRPLVAGMTGENLNNHLKKLLAGRESWYRQSDIIYPADKFDIEELLDLIASWHKA